MGRSRVFAALAAALIALAVSPAAAAQSDGGLSAAPGIVVDLVALAEVGGEYLKRLRREFLKRRLPHFLDRWPLRQRAALDEHLEASLNERLPNRSFRRVE